MATSPTLILASASPARRQLLIQAGIVPVVYPSRFDESSIRSDDPSTLVEQLALGKATTVAQQIQSPSEPLSVHLQNIDPAPDPANSLVLGCDSLLVVNDQVYGKPETPEVAIACWKQMRGRTGKLLTGHALIDLGRCKTQLRHQATQVTFADLSDGQIDAYVATEEPLQCAGAFALDGQGGLFIQEIVGCYSNVIGLSLPLLREMVETWDYAIADFWSNDQRVGLKTP